MTCSESGQTLKAIIHSDEAASAVAPPPPPPPPPPVETSSSTIQASTLVEPTNVCSRSQRKRIIRWLGGIHEHLCCTCSSPQQRQQRRQQDTGKEAVCGVCGGMVDMSVSVDGLRRKQSNGSLMSTTSEMVRRVGKVFGRRGEDTKPQQGQQHMQQPQKQKQRQKQQQGMALDLSTIQDEELEGTVAHEIADNNDENDSSSDSTETQQSENTLAWLSGDGSSAGADGGRNKKPDLGLEEKAARLKRAQKLLNKSGNG